jgi:hypothetical protein
MTVSKHTQMHRVDKMGPAHISPPPTPPPSDTLLQVCAVVACMVPILNVTVNRRYSVIHTTVLQSASTASKICCEIGSAFPLVTATRLGSGAIEFTLLRRSTAADRDVVVNHTDTDRPQSDEDTIPRPTPHSASPIVPWYRLNLAQCMGVLAVLMGLSHLIRL